MCDEKYLKHLFIYLIFNNELMIIKENRAFILIIENRKKKSASKTFSK
jgi:hypothetical protein